MFLNLTSRWRAPVLGFCACLLLGSTAVADLPTSVWTGGLSPTDAEVGMEEPQTLLFGSALAIDGATVLAGMPEYREGRGRVAVFTQRTSGEWPRSATLTGTNLRAGDLFGAGVSLSGDVAAVTSNRALHIFKRVKNKWSQAQRIAVNNNEWLTGAVQVSGTWAAAGVDNPNGTSAVILLHADANGRWTVVRRVRGFDAQPHDSFGYSLALWRDTLVVGASTQNESYGAAYIFKRLGTRWSQLQKLAPSDGAGAGAFGTAVAVLGNVVVVGAPQANYEGGFYAGYDYLIRGSAYVYSRQGATFGPLQRLRPERDENSWYYNFGDSVAIANERIAVAAAWPVTRWDASYVFLYELHRRSYVAQSMLPAEASAGDGLALSGSALIAGVPYDPYYGIGYALMHEFDLVE